MVTSPLGRLLDDEHLQASARVVLTTVFGDALRPRNARAGVRQLAQIMEPLGVNERAVRTALHRLSADGLVTSEREGRHSFYRVAPDAEPTFDQGESRIYGAVNPEWDGEWTVVVADATGEPRASLDRALTWAGFRQVHAAVWMSPTATPETAIDEAARVDASLAAVSRGPLIAGSWDDQGRRRTLLDPDGDLEALYLRHLRAFDNGATWQDLDPPSALSARILLITNWRRLALRTPSLPAALVPADWPGTEARELTRTTYRALQKASERHLDELLGAAQATSADRWR